MKSVFMHPSKYNYNNEFDKYEFIGDSYIERAIIDLIYLDYPEEELKFYNHLLNLYVCNDSLAVVGLEFAFHKNIQYTGNLTMKMLADTVEAFIGCIAAQLLNDVNNIGFQKIKLDNLIGQMIYHIDIDSIDIENLYYEYLLKATEIAKTFRLEPLRFRVEQSQDKKIFVSTLCVDSKSFIGQSKTLMRSRLICLLKFIQSLNISLDFKNRKTDNGYISS